MADATALKERVNRAIEHELDRCRQLHGEDVWPKHRDWVRDYVVAGAKDWLRKQAVRGAL
jgi:hypothetical protein